MIENVYTIAVWYDGARFGIADYNGKPHFYRSIYLDTEEWNSNEDRFELSETHDEVKDRDVELQQIFQRWDKYRKSNPDYSYSDKEFGALPGEMDRYIGLKKYIKAQFKDAKHSSLFTKRGKFEYGQKPFVTWID